MLARLRELTGFALGRVEHFGFEEYLHGVTGQPLGTPDMAYTATGIVMLSLADAVEARRISGS
jgi:hypothetical protein